MPIEKGPGHPALSYVCRSLTKVALRTKARHKEGRGPGTLGEQPVSTKFGPQRGDDAGGADFEQDMPLFDRCLLEGSSVPEQGVHSGLTG